MNKCVFVIGPESSGSKLIAKVCAHVLGIYEFGQWNGTGSCESGEHKVYHRSLPYGDPPKYPDIQEWIEENKSRYELYFILTTRDISISELSRHDRWSRPAELSRQQSLKAKEIMVGVMKSGFNFFIWSYETFIFLDKNYLDLLYRYLGVESDFLPELIDGNRKKIIPH